MTSTRHLAIAAAIVAAAAAGGVAYWWTATPHAAPDVTYTRLDGSTARIADLRGKVVVVNFWATTCSTCVKEMPDLIATHRKFAGPRFDTLAVAMAYDPPSSVVHFSETRRLPFQVVIDNLGTFARAFDDVQSTPTTVLIDRRGRIVQRYVGPPDFRALNDRISQLMAEV